MLNTFSAENDVHRFSTAKDHDAITSLLFNEKIGAFIKASAACQLLCL